LSCERGAAASLPSRAAEDWPLAIPCTLISLHLLNAWTNSSWEKVVQFETRDSGDAPKPVFVALCVFFTKALLQLL
jgi:hypothetical protein